VLDKLHFQQTEHTEYLEIDVKNDEKKTPFDTFYKALFNFKTSSYSKILNPAAVQKFTLFTTYPGLLIGSGYIHDTNTIGDVKIGFFFDHTTGQPIIPGSSVKGMIRHVFELDENDHGDKCTGDESLNAIIFFLKEIEENEVVIDVDNLIKLKNEIFGDQKEPGTDTFFDAVLDIEKSGNQEILGNDFITPHINREKPELSPFSNPNPIQFIKVRPGIGFEFRFKLQDSKNYSIWTGQLKSKLFKKIIKTLGIGAKTNVGYGQFEENKPFSFKREGKRPITTQIKNPLPLQPAPVLELPQSKEFGKVKIGDKILGTVNDNTDGKLLFTVDVVGDFKVKPLKFGSSLDYKIGKKAILEVANKQKEKGLWMLTLKSPKFLPE
jgi:CRISPR-associated protein Cmr6